MKTLLYYEHDSLRDMVAFALESKFSVECVSFQNIDDVNKAVESDDHFDLIVFDLVDEKVEEFVAIANKTNSTPIIVCLRGRLSKLAKISALNIIEMVDQNSLIDELSGIIQRILDEKQQATSVYGPTSEFTRIKIDLLARGLKLHSDVFVRLSETKYLKIFNAGDSFTIDDLQKYRDQKKVNYFFVRTKDSGNLLSAFKSEVSAIIEGKVKIPRAQLASKTVAIQEQVVAFVNTLGVTPEVQEMIQANVHLVMKDLGNNPKLGNILTKFKNPDASYIANHSMMVGQIACALAAALEWSSESTFQKLTYAAMFHDVTLENDELAKIKTIEEFKQSALEFTEDEERAFLSHPDKASDLISQFHEIPPDVDQIVLQHHLRPAGGGFPDILTKIPISPLAAVFIVAHDLVDYFEEEGPGAPISHFLKIKNDEYASGNFKKALRAIAKSFA